MSKLTSRTLIPTAVLGLAMALTTLPAVRAQLEPELLPGTPKEEQEPAPTPTPVPLVQAGKPEPPLRPQLDFLRWQDMNARERQIFVEGAVLLLDSVASRLRTELEVDGTLPPEQLRAVVRFVADNHPKREADVYRNEMDSIYMTSEGQKLSLLDCFLLAFKRENRI